MRYSMYRDPVRKTRIIHIEIDDMDVMFAGPFDPTDSWLMTECDASYKLSDKLLGLEVIVRKIEEHEAAVQAQKV